MPTVTEQIKEWARSGAKQRLGELQGEIDAILRIYPDLKNSPAAPAPRTRKRKPMSAAARKAVGERMKAYWAAKRKKKG